MSRIVKVMIADDHEIVREGLETILSSQKDIKVVGVAVNGLEAITFAKKLKPDVILMDLVMPKLDGLQAIEEIRKTCPKIRILILTSFADDERIFPAMRAGALGYLLKDTPRDVLLRSIHEVAEGQVSLHPAIARRMVREINRPPREPSEEEPLTSRETETLCLIAKGMSNQEIAEKLGIHENTIAKYVSAILKKLNLENRTQAALYALRKGLSSLE